MEATKPCVSCGRFRIKVDKLDMGAYENWFVKCENCVGVTTVTHAVRDEAVRQWDDQYVWHQIDLLSKRAHEAESREMQVRNRQVEDQRILQFRYEKLADEYIKYRMLYSGTAGNINLETRRGLMRKEISAELGWEI